MLPSAAPTAAIAAVPEPATEEPSYYIVGNFTGWQRDDSYQLSVNEGTQETGVKEYVLTGVELKKDDELK